MKLFSHYIEQQNRQSSEIINWQNHVVCDGLSYSYRDTVYDLGTYPSRLHYHDYYELVVFEGGDIRYISSGAVFEPKRGDIVLIPPGDFHMSVIGCERTRYRRHVFYLYPSAFDAIGHGALAAFLSGSEKGKLLRPSTAEASGRLSELLGRLRGAFEKPPSPLEAALGLALAMEIFCFFNQSVCAAESKAAPLPENILMLQRYIDQNFSEISSVGEVAAHFFYSREYVSRLFRKHFDISISEYITKRRVAESAALLLEDIPVIDIAYRVGFGSLSAFLRAFRTVTGMTPTAYRRLKKQNAFK